MNKDDLTNDILRDICYELNKLNKTFAKFVELAKSQIDEEDDE